VALEDHAHAAACDLADESGSCRVPSGPRSARRARRLRGRRARRRAPIPGRVSRTLGAEPPRPRGRLVWRTVRGLRTPSRAAVGGTRIFGCGAEGVNDGRRRTSAAPGRRPALETRLARGKRAMQGGDESTPRMGHRECVLRGSSRRIGLGVSRPGQVLLGHPRCIYTRRATSPASSVTSSARSAARATSCGRARAARSVPRCPTASRSRASTHPPHSRRFRRDAAVRYAGARHRARERAPGARRALGDRVTAHGGRLHEPRGASGDALPRARGKTPSRYPRRGSRARRPSRAACRRSSSRLPEPDGALPADAFRNSEKREPAPARTVRPIPDDPRPTPSVQEGNDEDQAPQHHGRRPAEGADFYTRVLGFRVKHDVPAGPFRWITVVSPGDRTTRARARAQRGTLRARVPGGDVRPGIPLAAFEVSDLGRGVRPARRARRRVHEGPDEMGPVKIAMFADTAGT
jgi:catechol 2,3-dioxygenase-like lactoylglutathione lyase family enzyme